MPDEWLPVVKTWTNNYTRMALLIEEISAINRQLLRERRLGETEQEPRRAARTDNAR